MEKSPMQRSLDSNQGGGDKKEESNEFFANQEVSEVSLKVLNNNLEKALAIGNKEKAKKILADISDYIENLPENRFFIAENGEKFPIFKTIELTTKTPEEYEEEIGKQGMIVHPSALDMLNRMDTLKNKEEVELIVLSISELGFTEGADLEEIHEKANELGLSLCLPQVGPELRLNYKDQPPYQYLNIFMKSMNEDVNKPMIFDVGHDDIGVWLSRGQGDALYNWHGGDLFVFSSRK